MKYKATTKDAYKLFHEGALALADVESHGIAIDEKKLQQNINNTKRKIKRYTEFLKQDEIWNTWKKHYGTKSKLGSREQLGQILFTKLGHTCSSQTPTGRPKADEKSLLKLDIPFVKKYLQIEKLKKALSTYLYGIQRATINGFLHPSFNLHLARTYRSSSSDPNFQNIPIRLPWVSELIRSCFIARPDHHFVEIDYGGIEVCMSACNHKDPTMIEYIQDDTKDMHRDMAREIYMCDEVTKDARYSAKNGFVFPQFYGDWYKTCAKSLWENNKILKLTLPDGTPMKQHLATKRITELGPCVFGTEPKPGTFEYHIKEIEHNFWYNRFNVYREWKEKVWADYQQTGRFEMLTGFTVEGLYGKNDVTNYYMQGPAFHCLLWSLIKLNKWLKEKKMRSRVTGQIHDSIIADVHKDELQPYLYMANKIMTRMLPKAWPWIIVPLKVEAEVVPLSGNWLDKKEIKL